MRFLSWEEGKIMEDLLGLSPFPREKFSSPTPFLPSLFVALLEVSPSSFIVISARVASAFVYQRDLSARFFFRRGPHLPSLISISPVLNGGRAFGVRYFHSLAFDKCESRALPFYFVTRLGNLPLYFFFPL